MSVQCPLCGVPTVISRTHRWEKGCIVNRASGNANFCVYEASFHNRVLEELERRLGPIINRMVYIAGRAAAAEIARNLFTSHPLMQRLTLLRFTRAIGMGRIELLGHRKGRSGAVRVTDPFHLAHCTAVILGGLDVMYGFPVSFTARQEGDGYIGELVPGKRDALAGEEAYRRLTPERLLPSAPGGHPSAPDNGALFTPCRRCGAPSELGSSFAFDLGNGVITEKETGERHIFYGLQSVHAILREFELELGPEVGDLFVSAEKEGLRARLAGDGGYGPSWDLRSLRSYLALRGMGLLSRLEEDTDGAELEIANAFLPTVVVGRLAALWEIRRGMRADCAYSVRGNVLSLRIRPAP